MALLVKVFAAIDQPVEFTLGFSWMSFAKLEGVGLTWQGLQLLRFAVRK
jgi:hypothetical protein